MGGSTIAESRKKSRKKERDGRREESPAGASVKKEGWGSGGVEDRGKWWKALY